MGEIIKFPRHKVRRSPTVPMNRSANILRISFGIISWFGDDDSVDDCVAALKQAIEFLEMENEA